LVTAFPPGIAAGATFNKELIYDRARAIGQQFRIKGVDAMLGPVVGPLGTKALAGRNWEAFGSDAYLQGISGGLTVRGVQEQGVIAVGKHFVGYEQETFRLPGLSAVSTPFDEPISSNIDDRTMHEVYGWPFMDMVHEGVGSMMCSYNRLNNTASCANSYALNNILKTEYGFPGFVMSDWAATKSGVDSVIAGLDMNMPGGGILEMYGNSFFGSSLTASVLNGTVSEERLDDMVIRILASYYLVGRDQVRSIVGGPNYSANTYSTYGYVYPAVEENYQLINKHINSRNAFTEQVALNVGLEAAALVKNTGSLPVNLNSGIKKIGVVGVLARPPSTGANKDIDMFYQPPPDGAFPFGGGSGQDTPSNFISPLEAINKRATDHYIALDYYVDQNTDDLFEDVVINSDVNFIFGGQWDSEGIDRTNYTLSNNSTAQILAAAQLNNNNVVIITSTGQVDVEQWIDHPNITAAIFTVPQGAYAGEAIAQILFGEYNPSGRMPFTVARNSSDYIPIQTEAGDGNPEDNFKTGLYYDYRLFDKNDITPRFEFGFGLSYSTFNFSNLAISKVSDLSEQLPAPPSLGPVQTIRDKTESAADLLFPAGFKRLEGFVYPYLNSTSDAAPNGTYQYPPGYSTTQPSSAPLAGGGVGGNPALWDLAYQIKADVKNWGSYNGAYVLQLYVGVPAYGNNTSPVRQLRGFEKVSLGVGESATVNFDILRRDLSIWDTRMQSWIVPRGEYQVYVGSSSRNLELQGTFTIS
jgi:beta-glucosidase